MNIGYFGFGRAGCYLGERLSSPSHKKATKFTQVFDTVAGDFEEFHHLDDNQMKVFGWKKFNKRGSAGDMDETLDVIGQIKSTILSKAKEPRTDELDAFVISAGIGGGTGGAGASYCSKLLREEFPKIPIYAIAILPMENEPWKYTVNAARALKTLSRNVDNTILVDNGRLGLSDHPHQIDDEDEWKRVNRKLAKSFKILFSFDEVREPSALAGTTGTKSRLLKTLNTGGLSTLTVVEEGLPFHQWGGIIGGTAELYTAVKQSLIRSNREPGPRYDSRRISLGIYSDLRKGTPLDEQTSVDINQLDAATNDTDDGHIRKFNKPTDLAPFTLFPESSLVETDPTIARKHLHLIYAPSKILTNDDHVILAEWSQNHSEASETSAFLYPGSRSSSMIVTLCADIGIPKRVQEIQEKAAQIWEKQQQETYETTGRPKDVDVLGDAGSNIPPAI